MALQLGLKVDAEVLPAALVDQIKAKQLNLDDPVNTWALLKLNAVLGVSGFLNADGSLNSVGIQCAPCHSNVDHSFAPGIGKRLDGWANRDLNIGAIPALAPDLSAPAQLLMTDQDFVRQALGSWGPGNI
jgi:hypothetical protein